MKLIQLTRYEDVSGVSGTGLVAEGIMFRNGQCVISWLGEHSSLEIHPNLQSIIDIHGHGGKTKVSVSDDYYIV